MIRGGVAFTSTLGASLQPEVNMTNNIKRHNCINFLSGRTIFISLAILDYSQNKTTEDTESINRVQISNELQWNKDFYRRSPAANESLREKKEK
jgi:hypothetical protein